MKIRIGNDIRLNLTLTGINQKALLNIKQLRAYLINTSMKEYCEPWNPCCCSCCHGCGFPGYHHHPENAYHYHLHHIPHHHCCDCDHWLYGCRPCHSCAHLHGPVPCNPAFGPAPLPPCYNHCFGHCDFPNAHHCCFDYDCKAHHDCHDCAVIDPHIHADFRYLAPTRLLDKTNRVQVYFPACDQMALGVYKLVIVAVVYEAGWGRCNLHTYTIDKGEVFTLVDDESGSNGNITVDVDTDSIEDSNIADIIVGGEYYIYPGRNLKIGSQDNYGNTYKVDVVYANGGQESFDPDAGLQSDDGLLFKIADDKGGLEVNRYTGTISAVAEATEYVTHMIEVYSAKKNGDGKPAVAAYIVIHVEGDRNKDYIGFAPVRPHSPYGMDAIATSLGFNRTDQNYEDLYNNHGSIQYDPQESDATVENGDGGIAVLEANDYKKYMLATENIFGTFKITNQNIGAKECPCDCENCTCNRASYKHEDGEYLWIISRSPISRVSVGEASVPIARLGLNKANNMYYYCSLNPIIDVSKIEDGIEVTVS